MTARAGAKGTSVKKRPVWRHPAFRIVGSAVILALLLIALPFGEMKEALRRVPLWVWPVALGVYMLLHLMGVEKWRLLINVAGAELPFAESARLR